MDLSGLRATYAIVTFDLAGCDLNHANFSQAAMMGISLKQIHAAKTNPPSFHHAILCGTSFVAAGLQYGRFGAADLTNAILSQTNLSQADLGDGAVPTKAHITYANLDHARFDSAVLIGSDFSYSYLYGGSATVTDATMTDVIFGGAYLNSLNFSSARDKQLGGSHFIGACLVVCTLQGTDLTGACFDGACLQGADFSDGPLNGAQLDAAAVAAQASDPGDPDAPGPLTVFLSISGRALMMQVAFQATSLASRITTATTTCPNGEYGPCEGPSLCG